MLDTYLLELAFFSAVVLLEHRFAERFDFYPERLFPFRDLRQRLEALELGIEGDVFELVGQFIDAWASGRPPRLRCRRQRDMPTKRPKPSATQRIPIALSAERRSIISPLDPVPVDAIHVPTERRR